MDELARKLMNLRGGDSGGSSGTPTAIFGTAGQLSRSLDTRERVRIGLWPCVSKDAPELAMGLMTALGFLLERWRDIRVYRLFIQAEDDPAAYQWTIAKSQFDVDEWQLEPLDENVAIWGTLTQEAGLWTLTLNIENDLADDRVEQTLAYTADNVAGLVNVLPKASEDIAENVETAGGAIADAYDDTHASEEALKAVLGAAFDWQVRLLLNLWGQSFDSKAEKLVEAGKATGDEFGAWLVSSAVAHAMLPGYGTVAEEVGQFGRSIVDQFPESLFAAIHIADGFYRLGQVQPAYDLLEAEVKAHERNVSAWLRLALLYASGGRLMEALDTYQRAIEADAVNRTLYVRYALLLQTLDSNNMPVSDFILIDPDDYDEDLILWEAVEAYEEALTFDPEDTRIMQQQQVLLIDLGDEESVWEGFEKLVALDEEGRHVRNVVDMFYNVDDVQPGIDILKKHSEQAPGRYDLLVNMAVAYLNGDEEEEAIVMLERAQSMTDDPDAIADIERLLLSAADPEFEMRLAEIVAMVEAGHRISSDDADFLEEALDDAPSLSEAYVALGKAYLAWEEPQDALDTLLDGHTQLPQDPDIIETLARVLWQSDEHELAFDYLNKGIAANPRHVPLLALTGQFLVEDEQEEAARTYLTQAEAISPRHPALAKARQEIAETISKRDA